MGIPMGLYRPECDGVYGVCPEYDVKIVLGDFNEKISTENIFGELVNKYTIMQGLTALGFLA